MTSTHPWADSDFSLYLDASYQFLFSETGRGYQEGSPLFKAELGKGLGTAPWPSGLWPPHPSPCPSNSTLPSHAPATQAAPGSLKLHPAKQTHKSARTPPPPFQRALCSLKNSSQCGRGALGKMSEPSRSFQCRLVSEVWEAGGSLSEPES